jgi:hypothetical protein
MKAANASSGSIATTTNSVSRDVTVGSRSVGLFADIGRLPKNESRAGQALAIEVI